MNRFKILGRVVTHTARPRFSLTFKKHPNGGWESDGPVFTDDPPKDAALLARLMREAGDFFAANVRGDWMREAVIARAKKLGVSSYEIAKGIGNAASEDSIADYLKRGNSMGSHKLQHVIRFLWPDFNFPE
jgi:hypothetical protein